MGSTSIRAPLFDMLHGEPVSVYVCTVPHLRSFAPSLAMSHIVSPLQYSRCQRYVRYCAVGLAKILQTVYFTLYASFVADVFQMKC